MCDGGKVFRECGSPCPQTCDGMNIPSGHLFCPAVCLRDCFCPPGTILHQDQCIPQHVSASSVIIYTQSPYRCLRLRAEIISSPDDWYIIKGQTEWDNGVSVGIDGGGNWTKAIHTQSPFLIQTHTHAHDIIIRHIIIYLCEGKRSIYYTRAEALVAPDIVICTCVVWVSW